MKDYDPIQEEIDTLKDDLNFSAEDGWDACLAEEMAELMYYLDIQEVYARELKRREEDKKMLNDLKDRMNKILGITNLFNTSFPGWTCEMDKKDI